MSRNNLWHYFNATIIREAITPEIWKVFYKMKKMIFFNEIEKDEGLKIFNQRLFLPIFRLLS